MVLVMNLSNPLGSRQGAHTALVGFYGFAFQASRDASNSTFGISVFYGLAKNSV